MTYDRLRDLREDADLTQKNIAKLLYIAKGTYSRYERGQVQIPSDCVVKLADFYHTTTDYILGRTNDPVPLGQRPQKRKG